MYALETTKPVDKVLAANKVLAKRFYEWVTRASISPHTENDGTVKNRTYEGLAVYKKRLGTYRTLFVIKDDVLVFLVYRLEPRGSVYD